MVFGRLQERPAVVDVHGHPRVLIGMVGVALLADLHDPRVDVDGVDVLGALGQCDRDVGPGPCADDQYVVQRVVRSPLVRLGVLLLAVGQLPVGGRHQLVRNAVDRDVHDVDVVEDPVLGLDLVVRGPADAGSERLQQQRNDHPDPDDRGEDPLPAADQQHETGRDQEAPDIGRGAQERHAGEQRDADQRTDQVVSIGGQRTQAPEAPADDLGRTGQDDRDHDEDDRQHQPGRRPGGVQRGEVDDRGPDLILDLHREQQDEEHQRGQQDRRDRQDRPAPAGDQEADADTQERAEQHEVREIAQVHDVGTQPTDQREFQEQHHGAAEHQPGDHRPLLGPGRQSSRDVERFPPAAVPACAVPPSGLPSTVPSEEASGEEPAREDPAREDRVP